MESGPRNRRADKAANLTGEQIIAVLREQEASAAVVELCRKHGVTSPTFYKWKAKFSGMDVSEVRRLKALEEDNGRLKRMLADAKLARDRGRSPRTSAIGGNALARRS